MTNFICLANWLHRDPKRSALPNSDDAAVINVVNSFAISHSIERPTLDADRASSEPSTFNFTSSKTCTIIEEFKADDKMSELEHIILPATHHPRSGEADSRFATDFNYFPDIPEPVSRERRGSTSRFSRRFSSVFGVHSSNDSSTARRGSTTSTRRPSSNNFMDLLCTAAATGEIEQIGRILSAGGNQLLSKRNSDGLLPIHVAVISGQADSVRCLVRMGSSISARDEAGCTPLTRAAMKGHQNLIAQLVNLGADPDERLDNQRTALHIAAELPCEDAVVRERRASTTSSIKPVGLRFSYAFHETIEPRRRSQGSMTSSYDECSSIEALIRAGANKDSVDIYGDSALHIAVRTGIETNVRILVDQGVAINARNLAGQTPLDVMAARSTQDPGISSFLLSRGAILAPSEGGTDSKRKSSWFSRSIL